VSEKPQRNEFLEGAIDDLIEAQVYLETQRLGSSDAFQSEVDAVIDLLMVFPELGRLVHPSGVRQSSLKRFPYSVVYALEGTAVAVIAIAHHKREPDYWLPRLNLPDQEP
jgi:toxin ParE1/3/4